ncbi:hypothetical protein NA56DRAFT_389261 [Hyaloscypha hepaticicola]|uniref:Uncharacterized protein n=1 Tax=Hyaloscypha hepaticicola TaxID=2082293 RepID=A0A2J6QI28_9HELO|nr:hypothetical protein NA56DRAFT_389261 [Hyaloscypha hepaticicola]
MINSPSRDHRPSQILANSNIGIIAGSCSRPAHMQQKTRKPWRPMCNRNEPVETRNSFPLLTPAHGAEVETGAIAIH